MDGGRAATAGPSLDTTLGRGSRRKGMCFLRRKGGGATGAGRLGRPDPGRLCGNNVLQARDGQLIRCWSFSTAEEKEGW